MSKKKKKTLNNDKKLKRTSLIFNYSLELIFIVALGISILIDIVFRECLISNISNHSADIIIVLLPSVVTTLSIILSLQKERIYGIENSDFRKLRGEKTYNFLEMMNYTIVIFVIFVLTSIFNFIVSVWVLEIITVIYSFIFIHQEIPILIRDDKRIKKIIRNNIHRDKKSFTLEALPNAVSMETALQNLLFTEGILSAYRTLETESKERNREYLDRLLSLQNDYLWKYIDNHSIAVESSTAQYKGIDIVQVVSKSLENIEAVVSFTNQLNIIDIYGDEEHFYHITRSMFSLYSILTELSFNKKYRTEFRGIITSIFMNIRYGKTNDSKNRFLYKILNAMLINTLSNSEMWFLEILQDSSYNDSFSIYGTTEYMVFVTAYLFYLIKLENRVPQEFKIKLQAFLNSNETGIRSNGDTWLRVLQHKLNYININVVIDLLQKILYIYDCYNNSLNWYEPSFQGVWTSLITDSFSKRLLMNWWIGYILTSDALHAYSFNSEQEIKLPELSESESEIFAVELNKNWFIDDQLNTEVSLPILEFFWGRDKVYQYMDNSPLVNSLKEFKNKTLKRNIAKEIQHHIVTPTTLEKYKNMLVDGLKNAIDNFSVIDKSIDVSDEEMKHFGILFDTKWSDSLVKQYAENMPESLSRLLYEETLEALEPIKKNINEYNKEELQAILNFKPTSRHAYIYSIGDIDESKRQMMNEINKIPTTEKLWIPHDLFLRGAAIAINFEYCEKESFVRKLTSDEINVIVDRDYKIVNGLYKYEEGANGDRSVLLSREEIIRIVTDKFFYASIVFKYKATFKLQDILYYHKEK